MKRKGKFVCGAYVEWEYGIGNTITYYEYLKLFVCIEKGDDTLSPCIYYILRSLQGESREGEE